MASHEQALVSLINQVALSCDGAFLGLALAYVAVRSVLKFTFNHTALDKLRKAPSLSVSDLRSLLGNSETEGNFENSQLVIVRGTVQAKSVVDSSWKSFRPSVLVSRESGDKAVVVQRTQTEQNYGAKKVSFVFHVMKCIYNEWKGFFGWTSDLRALFSRSWRQQESTSFRTVPFVLIDGRLQTDADYVVVNLDGSRHPLPLTTVYHKLQPINASPYTFLQALFGHEYPVGLLDEEKILPLGKDINAVGLYNFRDGIAEIKSSKDLPYFLTDMSKDQMIGDLALKTNILLFAGIVFGSMSVAILGYAAMRNWNKWKEWRQRRQLRRQSHDVSNDVDSQTAGDDEPEEVPDGQLCVICLMRRRRSVFIPCGHLVCCQGCAISVEREVTPKCPVCRQEIRNSVRIFES